MSTCFSRAAALALAVAIAAPAAAQSLAEVARREEARRKSLREKGKLYTNESLGAAAAAEAPERAAQPPASAPSPQPRQDAAQPGEEPRGEQYWRDRITQAREALSRAQIFAEALQSRINALTADFVARDDPAQRAVVATDRQKALAELDRVKREIETHQKSLQDIEEEARRAGVPPGWLR